jgi:hypothetical protein
VEWHRKVHALRKHGGRSAEEKHASHQREHQRERATCGEQEVSTRELANALQTGRVLGARPGGRDGGL